MNKTSAIFIAVGLLVLVGVGYLVLKPKPQPATPDTNQGNKPIVNEPPPPVFVEVVLDYKKDLPADPKTVRVEEGQKVVIKATADISDEVHLHGYDISVDVKPGQTAILEFTANKTGRFPVELEKF
jgi:heme/copper-type cytochrome/quinol oxidase subunit 2